MDFTTTREDIVRTCYRLLLGRDPEPGGLQHWVGLPVGSFSLHAVMHGIVTSDEFVRRHGAAAPPLPPDRLVDDRAQFGEVGLLLREIVNRTARHRIVVDVGANGIVGSNSYDLLRHFGWRGLLVEPNPERCDAIRRDFAGLDFALVQAAVSDRAGEETLFLGPNDDVSSLSAKNAADWGALRGELRVKVETLSALLEAHGVPRDFDLLSVDAEGEDIRILNESTAAGWQPRWVIIEASQDYAVSGLDQLPVSDGVRSLYAIAARTRANLILARTG